MSERFNNAKARVWYMFWASRYMTLISRGRGLTLSVDMAMGNFVLESGWDLMPTTFSEWSSAYGILGKVTRGLYEVRADDYGRKKNV